MTPPAADVLDDLEDDLTAETEDEVDELEDEDEGDLLDEMPPETNQKNKGKKERKHLSPDNVYVFDSKESAKEATDALKYTNGSAVEGYRIWSIIQKRKDGDKPAGFVLAKTLHEASKRFMDFKNYVVDMLDKKRKGGVKGPRKISYMQRALAKNLGDSIFVSGHPNGGLKEDAPPTLVNVWTKNFAPGGTYEHYIDTTQVPNIWKEHTCD